MWLVVTRHGPLAIDTMGDLYVYDVYHHLLHAGGLAPYRDLDFEYPPGALVPILLIGGDATRMSLAMLGCAVVAQVAAWGMAGARAGWAMVLLPVAAGSLVRLHFDVLPTALAMVGLWLMAAPPPWPRRGTAELGLAVLALGTMTKLWPAAIAVVAIAWLLGRGDRAAALRGGAAFLAVCLAIGVPFAAGGGFPKAMVQFHLQRPVQIESTPATVVEIVGGAHVTGAPITQDRFKSNGVDGGPADAIGALALAALLVAAAGLAALVARRPSPDGLLLAALAITLAFVAFGKVLSPQYLCWLLPLAAVVAARGAWAGPALIVAAAAATQVYFPRHYFDVVGQDGGWVALVGVRNALLLLALAATARALARSPRHAAAARRSG